MKTLKKSIHLLVMLNFLLFGTLYSQSTPKLSDPEVAHAAVTANQIDIDAGEMAKQKSKNPEIIKFAETMINDHKGVIQQASDLAKKLGVTPKDNDFSKKLTSDSKKTAQSLKTKQGKEFDKAYIDNEVAYHKAVISAVQGVLIPETENAELKKLLENVVPALKAHLQHAEMVQSALAGK
jgi:putative membrane protein